MSENSILIDTNIALEQLNINENSYKVLLIFRGVFYVF